MSEKRLNRALIISLMVVALGIGVVGGLLIAKRSAVSEEATGKEAATAKQLYSCGMHPQIIQEGPGNCPICGMKLTPIKGTSVSSETKPIGERKIKYWKSSMDPTFVSDKPGKDQMGMDLVPVYEDQVQEGAISVDPVTVQNMGIRTAMVEEKELTRTIRTVGNVDYNEELLYTVNAKISGWIEKLYVGNTGDPVKKGQPLLEIYSPELVSTQQEYLTALKNFQQLKDSPYPEARRGAEELLKSTRQRLLYWDISAEQIDKLEKSGEVKKTMILYSPANGVVTEKNLIEGASIEMGSELYKIADLSTVWILAKIYEYELPYIKIGQTAQIKLSYFPGEVLSGKISYIYPYLNQTTRDVKVRIELPNPEFKLKPEMYANVNIASTLPDKSLVVPEEAVIHSGKREIVFVDAGGGKYSPREVVTGASGEGNVVEVKSGLMPDEMVVVSAQFMLDSESKTQEAIKKMLESRKQGPVTSVQKPDASVKSSDANVSTTTLPQTEKQKAEEHKDGNLNLTPNKMAQSAGEVYTCPMPEHSHILQVGPGDCPECGMKLVPITQTGRIVYTCPMEEHHNVLSDKPGKCPECGMELVPLK
ncbi:MAG: efflux RND transporter periplasmic adaptor subunit [Candidatus Zixiibacteriota bacterium]